MSLISPRQNQPGERSVHGASSKVEMWNLTMAIEWLTTAEAVEKNEFN